MWFAIGVIVLSIVGSMALNRMNRPKGNDQKASDLSDDQLPIAAEGEVIPVVFGTRSIRNSNVVARGDFRSQEHSL